MDYHNIHIKKTGGIEMKKICVKFFTALFRLSIIVATVAVNTTCARRYYQEKFDEQCEGLKKYKN